MRTNTKKYLLTLLIFCIIILLSGYALARAGGGGGGSGGGGGMGSHSHSGGSSYSSGSGNSNLSPIILILIIVSLSTLITTIILFLKVKKSQQIINQAKAKDPFWDHDYMKKISEEYFHIMQKCWMQRDLSEVKNHISKSLYENYSYQLNHMKEIGEINIIENIFIEDIKIISCEDFHNNAKDSFIAYIKGTIVDYKIYDKSQYIKNNPLKSAENFIDTYHFIRKGNSWILNYIDNDVSLNDLITSKNYKED